MNMFCRILIVLANVVLMPISLPISIIGYTVWIVYVGIKYGILDRDFVVDCVKEYGKGIVIGMKNNARFLKTGDLEEFANRE